MTTWCEMTTEEQTAYLVPLIGTYIKIALTTEVEDGRKNFGPDFPPNWTVGILKELLMLGSPKAKNPANRFKAIIVHITKINAVIHYRWDNIHAIQKYEGIEYSQPLRNLNCPHCGKAVEIKVELLGVEHRI